MKSSTFSRRDLFRLGLAAGVALPCRLGTAAGEERPKAPQASAPDYLGTAVRAAHWIRTTRVETPEGLLWLRPWKLRLPDSPFEAPS